MKRKQKEHLRERLLDQGIQLVTEHGYHGTGLKKILDTVQVPKGSFYNYFESKEKYVAEVIKKYSDDQLSRLDKYLETTEDDPVTVIRYILQVMHQKHEQEDNVGCLTGNLAAEIGSSSKVCQVAMSDAVLLWKKRFVGLITEGQQQGLIRDDLSADSLADILWDTWQGALLRIRIDSDTNYLKNTIDSLMVILER